MNNADYKKKSDLHLPRKIWHMGGVLVLFSIWNYFSKLESLWIYSILWVALVPIDFIRLKTPQLNQFFSRIFKIIMRSSELNQLAGTSYLLTSVIIIAFLFPPPIVSLSLLFLAFADPLASFVGIKWGRHKIFGHKSYEGFFAALIVCSAVTCFYFFNRGLEIQNYYLVILFSGLIGALAELIPVGKLDDNLTMPILSSICLYFLFIFFSISI